MSTFPTETTGSILPKPAKEKLSYCLTSLTGVDDSYAANASVFR